MTTQQLSALKQIISAVVDTVKETGPMGAPGGILYAGLMQYGCTLNQFESLMAGLVKAGKLTKQGECYHAA